MSWWNPFSRSKSSGSLDSQVVQIINENPDIRKYISSDPNLKNELYSRYNAMYDKYKGIIKGAELVDKVDRILGPIESALRWFGPGVGYVASFGLRAMEELMFKIPYSIYYAGTTRDFKGAAGYVLAETAATVLPYGDSYVDILPIYKNTSQKYLRNAVAKDFMDYLKKAQEQAKKAQVIPMKPKRPAAGLDEALERAA